MPKHDWTRVVAGTFHDFHSAWITHLKESLNRDVLPEQYYALAEQHVGRVNPDVLTLTTHAEPPDTPPEGALALALAPPQVSVHVSADEDTTYRMARRTLTIRHRTGRRIVAMIEILSPGNKDSNQHTEQFIDKAVTALQHGIHLLVIDLRPPGPYDPEGIHGAIWDVIGGASMALPMDKPLTLASYLAGRMPEAFVEPIGVGQPLPDMPLFLTTSHYVEVPLESTYAVAYAGLPKIVRDILAGRARPETAEHT